MRVLMTSTPQYGHLHPIVPLARALIAAGHEVRVACPASLQRAVEAAGLPFVAAGPTELHQQSSPSSRRPDPMGYADRS